MPNKEDNKESKISLAAEILIELMKSVAVDLVGMAEDNIFSCASSSQLAKNFYSRINKEQYVSAFQGLQRTGYIKKINEDQFLITPKAIKKIRILNIENADWEKDTWDGMWKIIAFDIPEDMKSERNTFRSLIRRKGFVGIQNSVFIAPFADFEQLALLRNDLKIEKYVSFFEAKSSKTDDDTALRAKFDLA